MTNQLALPADVLVQIIKSLATTFGTDVAAAIDKNPEFLSSLLKDSLTQELVKKNTLKGVFNKFQKGGLFGGLFGRGGLLSYLGQFLSKKSSINLTAGVPLSKNLDTGSQTEPIVPQIPLTSAAVSNKNKEQDYIDTTKPKTIPILFAGFDGKGKQDLTEMFSSLFKTLVKDIIKGLDGIMPEPVEAYAGEGIVPALIDNFLEPLLMGLPLLGPLLRRILPGRRSLGQGRKGARLRNAARRAGRGIQKPTSGAPPIKTTTPPTPASTATKAATTAGKTGAASSTKAATSSISKSASKGLGRSVARGGPRSLGRAIPGLGTALTVGFLASDLSSIAEQEAKGEITQKEAYEQKGGAWGGAGGALTGAAAGAAIGAMFGGVGAIPGALIGGLIGGIGGQMGGEAIGSAMAPKEAPPITPASDIKDLDIPEPKDYTQTLNNISTNTGTTVDKIVRLSDAIFALAGTFKTQSTTMGSPIFINGQQEEATPAAQIAANNIDAIRRVRAQFAV